MQREFWTKKLVRIVANIEADKTPSPVRELYVFGSYARGAPECRDLDLVVIHDPPSAELVKELTQKATANPRNIIEAYGAWDLRFSAMMSRAIRRPGEEIDLLIGTDLDKALDARAIKAGTAPRETFISPKLAEAREEEILQVGSLVRDQTLILTTIDTASLEIEELTSDWLELFTRRRWGKRIQSLIP